MDNTPQPIKVVGITYLIAGLLNLTMTWWVSSTIIATAGACIASLTMGLCPAFCLGFGPWLLIPVGLVEVAFGVWTLTKPEDARKYVRFVPVMEILSIIVGGLSSPIAGVVALVLLRNEEAVAYIEG